jgi:hypothetical protein
MAVLHSGLYRLADGIFPPAREEPTEIKKTFRPVEDERRFLPRCHLNSPVVLNRRSHRLDGRISGADQGFAITG